MNRKMRLVCLALILALAVSALPASAFAAGSGTDRLVTSYDPDNYLELAISGGVLTVSGKLRIGGLMKLWIQCGERIYIDAGEGEAFSASLDLDLTELTPVTVYYATRDDVTHMPDGGTTTTYHGYIWNTIYVERSGGGYRFARSLVLDNNLALLGAYADPEKYRDASGISAEVKAKSNEIVAGAKDDYQKIFLLHKWVAENIYYDYDSYYGNGGTFYDAGGVLESRRSVCAGYAALLRALILAQGIPAMEVSTYALGLSANGGSFAVKSGEAAKTGSNHAHVEAYVNGRWVAMDPTWDSNNRYENGAYKTEPVTDYFYFDITPEVMALDHKYITRGNDSIRFYNGAVVGSDPLPVVTAEPTGSTVLVNGVEVRFDAYCIDGNNYFKLRDLAYALNGSEKQFEVTWVPTTGAIELLSESAYTPVGGELTRGDGAVRKGSLNAATIYLDGRVVALKAYTINSNNYFKLRDLGSAFDFDVTWEGERNTIVIDTSRPYTPD